MGLKAALLLFTASGWLEDVRRYGCTFANYVGAPLSYILATPERADDADNPMRVVYGNEAPADVRSEFTRRFGVRVVDGNSVAKDMVAAGQLAFALTDTDDACLAIKAGKPVAAVFPDQGEGGMGTLVIPNTIALVRGARHPEEAQTLIDYLLSEEVEREVVKSGWSHLPVRPLAVEPECFDVGGVASMNVQYEALFDWLEPSRSELAEIFIR